MYHAPKKEEEEEEERIKKIQRAYVSLTNALTSDQLSCICKEWTLS